MSAERLFSTERLKERFIETLTPTERIKRVSEIDFAKYHQLGVNTLLLDAEGTFVEHNGWDVDPAAKAKIREAREQRHVKNIAIITNKKSEDEVSRMKLAWYASEMDADIVFTPADLSERKPGSKMLLKALQYFNVSADQALMVGDKFTGDILAANRAGTYSIKVERYGLADMTPDRLRRALFEDYLAIYFFNHPALLRQPPQYSAAAEELSTKQLREVYRAKRSEAPITFCGKISGLGGPVVKLYPEVEAAIPKMWYVPITDRYKSLIDNEDFRDFMKEHGREIADTLTISRIPLGVVGAILKALDKDTLSLMSLLTADGTDIGDGLAAGMSKEGKTKEGGRNDQRNDKFVSILVEIVGMLKKDIPARDGIIRILRDLALSTGVRPQLEARGVDTSAVWSGKASTVATTIADRFSYSKTAKKHPILNRTLQRTTTLAKIASALHSIPAWQIRHWRKEYDELRAEQVKDELLRRT